jgi:hypothetical protein
MILNPLKGIGISGFLTTPQTLTIFVNPSTLAAANYSGAINICVGENRCE